MNKKYYYWTFFIANILILIFFLVYNTANSYYKHTYAINNSNITTNNIVESTKETQEMYINTLQDGNIINYIILASIYILIVINLQQLIKGYKTNKYGLIEIASTVLLTLTILIPIVSISSPNFISSNIKGFTLLYKFLILPISIIAMIYRYIKSNNKQNKITIKSIFYPLYFLISILPLLGAFFINLNSKETEIIIIINIILIWIDLLLLIIFYKKEKFGLLELFSIGTFALMSIVPYIEASKQHTSFISFPYYADYIIFYLLCLIVTIPLTIAMGFKYVKLIKEKSI